MKSMNRSIWRAFVPMTLALAQIVSYGQTKGAGLNAPALVESQREIVPPEYIGAPLPLHDPQRAMMLGIPSLAISPGGRMWACWYSSVTYSKQHAFGEDENNIVTVVTSGDGGQTWETAFVIEPDFSGPRRVFDPEIWMAPDGRLRVTWTDRIGTVKSPPEDDQLWMLTLDNPEVVPETIPQPRLIATGVMMCKPTFLSDGTWALPVARWQDDHSSGMVVSTDGGKTFSLRGGAGMAKERRSYDEHMFVERTNGEIVCFSRAVQSKDGLLRATSKDRGKTWSELLPFEVKHTSARVFITRLASGHWLMVKHGPLDKAIGRAELTAYVSLDEGRTWQGGLMLDERKGVSYPDGQQTRDGIIHIIYDYDRLGAQEVLMASFTEEDALAGKVISGRGLFQQKVHASTRVER